MQSCYLKLNLSHSILSCHGKPAERLAGDGMLEAAAVTQALLVEHKERGRQLWQTLSGEGLGEAPYMICIR